MTIFVLPMAYLRLGREAFNHYRILRSLGSGGGVEGEVLYVVCRW